MDLGWPVDGFSDHRLIAGLGIQMLVVWQRRLTMCSLMIQNCRVLNTNHRLVIATLKLQLKSGRMVASQPRVDVGKLKDERVAEEFTNRLSGDLGGSGCIGRS